MHVRAGTQPTTPFMTMLLGINEARLMSLQLFAALTLIAVVVAKSWGMLAPCAWSHSNSLRPSFQPKRRKAAAEACHVNHTEAKPHSATQLHMQNIRESQALTQIEHNPYEAH